MIFDSHAHLSGEEFPDREEIIKNFDKDGILGYINPADSPEESLRALDLARKHSRVYAAAGSHPENAKDFKLEDLDLYKDLAQDPKLVAIGEIGLDYHYDTSPRDVQREVFAGQLDLAQELGLPVIIHMRDAHEDALDILKSYSGRLDVLMHCFSEGWEEAKTFLDLGFYLALGGMVTFKNAPATREVARNIPLDRLLVETDSPYMAPVPKRGRRNEPRYIKYVVQRIADERNIGAEEVAAASLTNTREFFKL